MKKHKKILDFKKIKIASVDTTYLLGGNPNPLPGTWSFSKTISGGRTQTLTMAINCTPDV